MRRIMTIVTLAALMMPSVNALCQDMDDPPEPTPADDSSAAEVEGLASFGKDEEDSTKTTVKKEEVDMIEGGNFVGVQAPRTWHLRNGFGVSLGLGSLFCYRDYCNSVIDVNMFGSITGTVGGFYRMNPNLVFTVDFMIGHMNTNMGVIPGEQVQPDKDNAMMIQPSAGAEFHLPILGWFDPYVGLSLGYSFMRAKAEAPDLEYKEKWHGINIEPRLGANMFLWSTGFARNLALGAFLKMGFPIWPNMCRVSGGIEDCASPKDMQTPRASDLWSSTPFTMQMSLEARYYF